MGKLQQTITFFLIIFFSILSFGEIIKFNFSLDDFTILYYVKRHTLLFYPYYGMSFIFEPLYSAFKLNSSFYYALSLTLFILNALGVFLFSNLIFGGKKIAFTSSLLFIFLFVGSDAMFSMSEGIRINLFLLLQTLTLFFYSSYSLNYKKKYLFLGILSAIILILIFPYRAHPLIVYIFLIELLLSKKRLSIQFVLKTSFPIIVAYILAYLVIPKFAIFDSQAHKLPILFYNLNLDVIRNTYLTLKNVIIPSQAMFDLSEHMLNISRLFFVIIFLSLIFFLKNKKIILMLLLLILSILGFTTLFGASYITHDRYLFVSRPLFSILLSAILWKTLESNLSKFIKLLVISLFLILIASHLKHGVAYKSEVSLDLVYSKKVFSVFKKEIKTLPKFSIIFLEGKDVPATNRLSRITQVGVLTHGGSMATYFNRDYEKIEVVFNCDALQTTLKNWKNKQVKIYYFFDSGDSLKLLSKTALNKKCVL